MSKLGYLYVLANSAMPGLVKVGKTNRLPSDRANELSNVTGIPTPFIIVYEQLFQDCSSAERFVHAYLESRGFRVAANREFFNAPVNDVVRSILAAPGAISNETVQAVTLAEPSGATPPAWLALYEQAEENYYGLGDVLQDHHAALRLYKQASKLGCVLAHARVGAMYEAGEGAAKSAEQAIMHFKEGANQGHKYCYWRLAILFQRQESLANSEKCAVEFLKSSSPILDWEQLNYSLDGLNVIHHWMRNDIRPPESLRKMILEVRELLKNKAVYFIEMCERDGPKNAVDVYRRILAYIEKM